MTCRTASEIQPLRSIFLKIKPFKRRGKLYVLYHGTTGRSGLPSPDRRKWLKIRSSLANQSAVSEPVRPLFAAVQPRAPRVLATGSEQGTTATAGSSAGMAALCVRPAGSGCSFLILNGHGVAGQSGYSAQTGLVKQGWVWGRLVRRDPLGSQVLSHGIENNCATIVSA